MARRLRLVSFVFALAASTAAAHSPELGTFAPDCADIESCTRAELQDAIDAAATVRPVAGSNISGGRVQIPCGKHIIASALVVPQYVTLEGCSDESVASTIQCEGITCIKVEGDHVSLRRMRVYDPDPTNATKLVHVVSAYPPATCTSGQDCYVGEFDVEDLMLRCNAASPVAGSIGVSVEGGLSGEISESIVSGCESGIKLSYNSNANLLQRVHLIGNEVGLELADGASPGCRDVTIVGSTIEGNELGLKVDTDCLVSIHGGHFENGLFLSNGEENTSVATADIKASKGRLAIFGTRFADPQGNQKAIHRTAVGTEYTKADVFVGGKLTDPVAYDAGALDLMAVDLASNVTFTGDVLTNPTSFSICQTLTSPGDETGRALWRAPRKAKVTGFWCETGSEGALVTVKRDDGTPANVVGATGCTTSGNTGSIAGAEAELQAGDRLDLQVVLVGDPPSTLTVCSEVTYRW